MKKIGVIFLALVLSVSLCSCNYSEDGIENFASTFQDFEVNFYLLPDEEFLTTYPTKNVEYHFRQEDVILYGVERSIVAVEYEQSTYEQAKGYCLETMMLSDLVTLDYNGYTFIENIELPIGQDRQKSGFPHWFNMFAYNDAKCELVFLGLYTSYYHYDDAEEVKANWGEFVEEYFGDIYDWG